VKGGSADVARWQARAKDLEQRVAAAAAEHTALSEELGSLRERLAGADAELARMVEALDKVHPSPYPPLLCAIIHALTEILLPRPLPRRRLRRSTRLSWRPAWLTSRARSRR